MLYVNYLALPLVAVTAMLFVAARMVLADDTGPASADKREGYAFGAIAGGLVMAVTGLHLSLTWPLPGAYNIAFGEPLAYFGTLLVIGGLALRRGVDLAPIHALGAVGGVALLVIAVAIARYGLTLIPGMASIAFAAVGLAALAFPFRGRNKVVRAATFALLVLGACLFAIISTTAVLHHLAPGSFDAWVPGAAGR
jgi:putative membrane protein